jgi:glycosyltransferase involved in cell wall biosynthesis
MNNKSSKPKIALVRGRNLKRFEAFNFEPLMKSYDLIYYTTINHKFDISDIKIPVKKLPSPADFADRRLLRSIYTRFFPDSRLKQLGFKFLFDHYMIGLESNIRSSDIVHTVELSTAYSEQAACMKKKGLVKRLVLTVWENIPLRYLFGYEFTGGRKLVAEQADHFVAVTDKAKRALMLEGVPEDKVSVLNMGVDLSRFKPGAKDAALLDKLGLGPRDFIILSIGKLDWSKGHHETLFALKELLLSPELSDVSPKLVIAGKGPHKEVLEKLVKDVGIQDSVIFVGFLSYDEINRLYNTADLFVHSSVINSIWQEQLGWVLAEAMASGLPVVSTLSGSIPEVVGDAGKLVPPGDSHSLYLAIKELILSKEKRTSLAELSRKRAEGRFDSNKVAKKLDAIYQKVLRL